MTDVKLTPQQEHALLLLSRSRRQFIAQFEPYDERADVTYPMLHSLEQLGLITWPQTVGVDLIELTVKGRSVVECLKEVSA